MTARARRAAACGVLAAWLQAAAWAAGAPPSSDLPDLSAVRVQVYAGEYAQAAEALRALTRTVQHAEVYNLLGYSLRQIGRYDEAAHWYREALTFDPEHRPALEYQGELFIALGDLEGARRNLRYLEILCGTAGCPEREQLRRALAAATARPPR